MRSNNTTTLQDTSKPSSFFSLNTFHCHIQWIEISFLWGLVQFTLEEIMSYYHDNYKSVHALHLFTCAVEYNVGTLLIHYIFSSGLEIILPAYLHGSFLAKTIDAEKQRKAKSEESVNFLTIILILRMLSCRNQFYLCDFQEKIILFFQNSLRSYVFYIYLCIYSSHYIYYIKYTNVLKYLE